MTQKSNCTPLSIEDIDFQEMILYSEAMWRANQWAAVSAKINEHISFLNGRIDGFDVLVQLYLEYKLISGFSNEDLKTASGTLNSLVDGKWDERWLIVGRR